MTRPRCQKETFSLAAVPTSFLFFFFFKSGNNRCRVTLSLTGKIDCPLFDVLSYLPIKSDDNKRRDGR